MEILIGILYFVEVVVCLLLALAVMLQKPKEGGLGGAISGGMLEASLGADAGNVLIKTTAVLGLIFLVNTLVLARFTSTVRSNSRMAGEAPAVQAETGVQLPDFSQTPVAPAAPAPAAAPAAPAAPAPAAAPAAPAPAAK